MNAIKKLWVLVLLMAVPAMAIANGGVHLDKAPINLQDQASLQRGAKLFTSRCLACHAASYMRYNRLRDIGMNEEQVKKDLELPEDVRSVRTCRLRWTRTQPSWPMAWPRRI